MSRDTGREARLFSITIRPYLVLLALIALGGAITLSSWVPYVIVAAVFVGLALNQARGRTAMSNTRDTLLRLCIPVAFLPLATAVAVQSRLMSIVLLGGLAVCAVADQQQPQAELRLDRLMPCALFGGLILLVWSRGHRPTMALITAGLVATITVCALQRYSRREVLGSLVDGIAIYLLASVALYAMGLRSPGEQIRLTGLDNSAGILSQRILFPLAVSYATAPALAAGYLAAAPALVRVRGGLGTRTRLLALIAAIFVLVAADYRAPLVYGLLIAGATLLAPRMLAKMAVILAIAALLLPFWYSFASHEATVVQDRVSFLSRSGGGGTLSYRDKIWTKVLNRFATFGPMEKLFGFGTDGHVTSGAAAAYARDFHGFLSPGAVKFVPPHNSILQALLDGGMVGALLLLGFAISPLRRLRRETETSADPVYLVILTVVLALVMTGGSEVTIAFTSAPQEPAWILGVVALVVSTSSVAAPAPIAPFREEKPLVAATTAR